LGYQGILEFHIKITWDLILNEQTT
jgi:hypothetical protein